MKDEFVHVYTVNGRLAGDMIYMLLESANIPCVISQESAGVTYGLTVGPLGEVRVYVPSNHLEEAIKLLTDLDEGKLALEMDSTDLDETPTYKNNKTDPSESTKED